MWCHADVSQETRDAYVRSVLHLLALIGEILPAARAERNWRGNGGAATMISADLGEAHLQVIRVTSRTRPSGSCSSSTTPPPAGSVPPAMSRTR